LLAIHQTSDITRIYKELNVSIKKWATELNRTFSKQGVQMAKKTHGKNSHHPWPQRKCKSKPHEDFTSLLLKWLSSRTPSPPNVGEDAGKKGTLIHCWWEHKLVQPLWKRIWKLLEKN
jgi:hypothetical protein